MEATTTDIKKDQQSQLDASASVAQISGVPAVPSAEAPAQISNNALFAKDEHKPKRTLGLRIFDVTFYAGVVNIAVMLASAASTYWTYHGNTVGKPGGMLRGVGEMFYTRRKPIENALGKVGITGEAAKIGTTVFWSFFDGTLFAPLIKLIEDRREKIALGIDTVLGTKADNMRAYDAEPKQGWMSVLVGRAETLFIVLPVAILMEKTGGNKKIFYDGGEKAMAWIEKSHSTLDKNMTRLIAAPHAPAHVGELPIRKKTLFHVLTFEGFYTSICTMGTYLLSRAFARHHAPKEADITHAHLPAPTSVRDESEVTPASAEKPSNVVSQAAYTERLQAVNDERYTVRA